MTTEVKVEANPTAPAFFADGVGMAVATDGTMRFTFSVTSFGKDPVTGADIATARPVMTLVMALPVTFDMQNQIEHHKSELEKRGMITLGPTAPTPATTPNKH